MTDDALALIDQDHFNTLVLAGTLDEKRKHIFLRVLAETANLKLAANAAGYKNTAAINKARRSDEAFDAAVVEAAEAAADMLEAEAVRRATQGVKRNVYFKGEIIDEEVIYSDSLLALLLKAAKPEKYSERVRQETNVNLRVGIAVLPSTSKSLEHWERESVAVRTAQKLLPGNEALDAEFKEVTPKLTRG
jgi:hypothetical protein